MSNISGMFLFTEIYIWNSLGTDRIEAIDSSHRGEWVSTTCADFLSTSSLSSGYSFPGLLIIALTQPLSTPRVASLHLSRKSLVSIPAPFRYVHHRGLS